MRLPVANPQDQEDLRQCRWRDCNRTEDDVCQLPHVRRFFFISERLEAALRRAKPPRENALTATAAKTTCLRLTGSARRRRPLRDANGSESRNCRLRRLRRPNTTRRSKDYGISNGSLLARRLDRAPSPCRRTSYRNSSAGGWPARRPSEVWCSPASRTRMACADRSSPTNCPGTS